MIVSASVDMISVKPIKMSDIDQGGIFQVNSEKQPEIGEVMDIGESAKKDLPFKDLKVGDKLLYRKYGSTNFVVGGSEYAFISFDDVVGRIK